MVRGRLEAVQFAAMLAVLAAAGCDDAQPTPPDATSSPTASASETATDPSATPTDELGVCFRDARGVPVPARLRELPLPDRTLVYDVERRGDAGVVLTAVSAISFRVAALQMRSRYLAAPYAIVGSNRSETQLGANWTGRSISGRWVVTDLTPTCRAETAVQILWTSAGGLAD